jgi:hypothetical protein
MKLCGRTKQAIGQARKAGKLAHETIDYAHYYDLDDPVVMHYVKTYPDSMKTDKKSQARKYLEEFLKARVAGEVKCAVTGATDLFGDERSIEELLKTNDADELDILNKKADIRQKELRADNLELKKQVMSGDLIERDYVNKWSSQYLGTLHTQILDFGGNGVCDTLFSIARRLEGREAIAEMEKELASSLSQLIKDAMDAMQKNPL